MLSSFGQLVGERTTHTSRSLTFEDSSEELFFCRHFRYLIVSRTRSSLILELGEDMVELEEPLFLSDEPTVAAGELADGGLAVQV